MLHRFVRLLFAVTFGAVFSVICYITFIHVLESSLVDQLPAIQIGGSQAVPSIGKDALRKTSAEGYSPSVRDQDLSLGLLSDPIPRQDFMQYSEQPHHNHHDTSGNTYATLLCTREPDLRDPFFAATQSLVWRLLWSPWHGSYPVVVFVCPFVPIEQREILRGQGALVKEIELLDDIVPADKVPVARWRDQFAKLNMWRETQYKKIAYFDVDALAIANIDDLFEIVPEQTCDKLLFHKEDKDMMARHDSQTVAAFCNFTFAGVDPYGMGEVNGGALFFTPNMLMYERLVRNAKRIDAYDYERMEQGLLHSSLGFGHGGPFKAHFLPPVYNAVPTYYQSHRENHDGGEQEPIRVIHDKMWSAMLGPDRAELMVRWDLDWMNMCRFYDSSMFVSARETGRLKEGLELFFENLEAIKVKEGAIKVAKSKA